MLPSALHLRTNSLIAGKLEMISKALDKYESWLPN